jgi:dipeptidase E
MRLYLSSFDLGDRPEELVALTASARRAAIIVNALDSRPDRRAVWLKEQTDKLVALGFSVFELDLRGYFGASDELKRVLSRTDLVWINGGNVFVLRRAMKQSGFDTLIKSALTRDEIVYAGISAAAVIAFDNLKGLELTDDPEDVPHGYDADIVWEGLGFSRSHLRFVSSRTIPSPNRLSAKLPFMKRLALRIEHCETAKRSLSTAIYRESSVLAMAAKGQALPFTAVGPHNRRKRIESALPQ